ncbi:MAG: GMC family oxidoreductase [Alphaproteobacteria bacterium]|nr:MAG: GMC family oxidoreductase [Alphaproteobacteria bacterium]
MKFRDQVDPKLANSEYRVQKDCYAFKDSTKNFFINDKENPYTHDPDKPFSWIRGDHLGGRSLLWHRQSYRWSDLDFTANVRDGHGVDWPIRYKDLEHWYDHVEIFVGVSGSREGIAHLPDGKFLPPHEMNCVETDFKARTEASYPDRKVIIGRCAHLTEPQEIHLDLGRGTCQARNQCQRGCSFGAYFSSQSATLPAAERTGNLTTVTHSIVHSLIYDDITGKATGVRVIDANTKTHREYSARVIFLCASTLGTTQILLNSADKNFPNGLANSSGVLGHYLMDHTMRAGATGRYPGFRNKYYFGRRPTGIYIPRFRNVTDTHDAFVRGYGFQGGAQREGWQDMAHKAGFGVDYKESIRTPGPWTFNLGGFGEMLPRYENYVRLHKTKRDKWGMPLLHINCTYGDNEKKMKMDMAETAKDMLTSAGLADVKPYVHETPPGLAIHEMGTARMGHDPATSVLNRHNQCHDVKNIFVTDGAAMTSSACQNPSITYMALTARAVDFVVQELKSGNL